MHACTTSMSKISMNVCMQLVTDKYVEISGLFYSKIIGKNHYINRNYTCVSDQLFSLHTCSWNEK